MNKLETLMDSEGFDDIIAFLDAFVTDSVAPAICMNDGCDYTCEMEQDQDAGYCEVCGTNSMKSAFVLANII